MCQEERVIGLIRWLKTTCDVMRITSAGINVENALQPTMLFIMRRRFPYTFVTCSLY